MKKMFIFIAIVGLVFVSCKKESNLALENSPNNQTTQKLIDFKNKLNSKDGGSLCIESATWHLEGLLNYENANNDHKMNNLSFNYDTLQFNYLANELTYPEMEVIYKALKNKL